MVSGANESATERKERIGYSSCYSSEKFGHSCSIHLVIMNDCLLSNVSSVNCEIEQGASVENSNFRSDFSTSFPLANFGAPRSKRNKFPKHRVEVKTITSMTRDVLCSIQNGERLFMIISRILSFLF